VNGNILKLKGMGFISGKTVIDMKESGNSVLNMVMGQTLSGMEIAIKENLKKEKQTAKVNTLGQMVQYMWVNSGMALSMEKADGNQQERLTTLINMKESILLIRSMDSVYSSGLVVTFIKGNILRMRGMAQVR
jgi:hypothetical protein